MQSTHNRLALNLALLCLLATVWGASYTFIKIGVQTIPPITMIASRTIIAAVILLTVMKILGVSMPRDGANWRRFLTQSLINSAIPFTLIAWAEQYIDAGLGTILNSTSPIFTFILTATITHHEPVTFRKLIGVMLGIAGIALVVGPDAMGGLGTHVLAQFAILAATVCYACAAIFGRSFGTLHPLVPAAGSLICGGIILTPMSLIFEHPWTLSPSTSSLLALLCLAVFSTAMAFILYFHLLRTLGSVGVTSQAYLRVPVGVFLGIVFLGETLSTHAMIGLVLVVGGVAAMVIPKRGAAKTLPSERAS